jgi:hypothetical protein
MYYIMFTKEDFTGDTVTRLQVIINNRIGVPPLSAFSELPEGKKKKYNRLLNEYVNALPENWESVILADFNQIADEDIFPNINPAEHSIYMTGKEALLSPDHEAFIREELKEDPEFYKKKMMGQVK